MSPAIDDWFVQEILPHEAALVRYLRRMWRNSTEVADLRQDIYLRVYEAAARCRPSAAKSYLFTTARNLMADRIRRSHVVTIESAGHLHDDFLVDEVSMERQAGAHEQLRQLATAFDALPPKCREVMWLHRVDGLSQQQVAEQMGISPRTVEKHVAKGMRLLAASMISCRKCADAGRIECDLDIDIS